MDQVAVGRSLPAYDVINIAVTGSGCKVGGVLAMLCAVSHRAAVHSCSLSSRCCTALRDCMVDPGAHRRARRLVPIILSAIVKLKKRRRLHNLFGYLLATAALLCLFFNVNNVLVVLLGTAVMLRFGRGEDEEGGHVLLGCSGSLPRWGSPALAACPCSAGTRPDAQPQLADGGGVSDVIAIAEMTPGSFGINCATFAGMRTAHGGRSGRSLGVMLPSLTLCVVAALCVQRFQGSALIRHTLTGIRPVCLSMIVTSAVSLAMENCLVGSAVSVKSIGIGLIAAFPHPQVQVERAQGHRYQRAAGRDPVFASNLNGADGISKEGS